MKEMLQEHIDSIDAYLGGQLSAEEKRAFESRLESDEQLKEAFDMISNLEGVIAFEKNKGFKKSLQNLETKQKDSKPKTIKLYIALAVAAGLAFFFLFTTVLTKTQEDLYATYFKAYPNTVVDIVRGDADLSQTQKAFISYQQGEYQESLSSFQKLEGSIGQDTLDFYKAITYMSIADFAQANALLNKINESKSNSYVEARAWYQILIHIALGNENQAKISLGDYIESGYSFNANKAKELASKLGL